MTVPELDTIGIVGGTGPQGRGLARRFALAGRRVLLGSRSPDRAAAAAAELQACGDVAAAGNEEAAAGADLVVVAVPYEGYGDLLEDLAPALAGKRIVTCVNPLGFDASGPYVLDLAAGSAAQEAQQKLPASTVLAAFHHVSAVRLADASVDRFDEDVLVLGEDRAAVEAVCDLVAAALPGARGVYAGRLRLAGPVEGLAANLIATNRRYRSHAGLRITDLLS